MFQSLVERYRTALDVLIADKPIEQGMSDAVGGDYAAIGAREAEVLIEAGLKDGHSVIDLGCGSGRLAKQLGARFPGIVYLGTDIDQRLLDYAAQQSPHHFRFVLHPEMSIPKEDATADFVVAFSLFTHLLHEHTYRYLLEARRVLKPGGAIVFSFLEMEPHWKVFEMSMGGCDKPDTVFNMFIEKPMIESWSKHLGTVLEGYTTIGQTVVLLRR